MNTRNLTLITCTLSVIAVIAAVACAQPLYADGDVVVDTTHSHDDNGGELTPAQRKGVADVRKVTVHFQALAKATAAGYTSQYPAGCAASPDGGQGFHYLNPALVDDKVELLKPELVMYEPKADGSMELVGVDYVVPFDKRTKSEAPKLLGMSFMRNEPLGVWALHIWAWRENPSGMFAMWNPKVSCAFAK